MSKTTLMRELRMMEKDQLIEIILQAYASGKETREYFEFFVNPDPKGMFDKYSEHIAKELSRVKHGRRTKARISIIKGFIKKFSSFEPGSEFVTDLYLYAIRLALETEKKVYFTETLFNGIKKLTTDAMIYADKHGCARQFLNGVGSMLEEEVGSKYFRRLVNEGLQTALQQ
ncbi:MAG: hypothetical protein HDS86_01105 [Bacteroidales bacterium]|nr:hypothetical protein [Bacteroidales bacterium]